MVALGKGHHLGDEHAGAVGAELPRQRIAADEGDVDEHRIEADVPRPGNQRGDRLVGADQNHRARIAGANVQQRRLHGRGVARIDADRHRRHVAPLQRLAHAVVAGAPEGVVLVHHGDAFDAEIAEQVRHHRLGLVVVGCAQVQHMVALAARVAQERSPGERRDVGYAGAGRHRHRGARRGRSHGADQREDAVLDQAARVVDGEFRLVAVVEGAQFERATMDAATLIRLLECRLDADAHVAAQFLGGPGKGRRLAEQDGLGRYRIAVRLGAAHHGGEAKRQQAERRPHASDASGPARCLRSVMWLRPSSRRYWVSSISVFTK